MIRLIADGECCICGAPLPVFAAGKSPLCRSCAEGIDAIGGNVCTVCGLPLLSEMSVCMSCRGRETSFDCNRALFLYGGGFKELYKRYKFGGRKKIAWWLAAQIDRFIEEHCPGLPVVPVPGNPRSIRARGWDQMVPITAILRKRYGHTVLYILSRKASVQQKSLDKQERTVNLRGKIRVNGSIPVSVRDVLLLDDIYTTGSTLNECSKALKEQGMEKVIALTLAID